MLLPVLFFFFNSAPFLCYLMPFRYLFLILLKKFLPKSLLYFVVRWWRTVFFVIVSCFTICSISFAIRPLLFLLVSLSESKFWLLKCFRPPIREHSMCVCACVVYMTYRNALKYFSSECTKSNNNSNTYRNASKNNIIEWIKQT